MPLVVLIDGDYEVVVIYRGWSFLACYWCLWFDFVSRVVDSIQAQILIYVLILIFVDLRVPYEFTSLI